MKISHYIRGGLLFLGLAVALLIGIPQLQAMPRFHFAKLPLEGVFSEPSGLAFRPTQPSQLWVANHGNDSVTIIDRFDRSDAKAAKTEIKTDAYAEHFAAKPSGIAFGVSDTFAIANDSNNEVRGMKFVKNPERNTKFVNNNFMGPTLFSANTYALAGQSKKYLEDWPQPGIGHDPPNYLTPTQGCPLEYWSQTVKQCYWPREGSHLDMLHGSPLAMGIAHDKNNSYFILDGCGSRDVNNRCLGNGHLVRYDFNRDHQEGNGYHGDGVIWRYPEIAFKRVENIPSGMLFRNGTLYFANTGMGRVERVLPNDGKVETIVSSWSGNTERHQLGSGVIDWADIPNSPGDGEAPDKIDAWIESKGNLQRIKDMGSAWIRPQEILSDYSYVYNVPRETIFSTPWMSQPSGLTGDDAALYIADYSSGWIAAIDWNTNKIMWRYKTSLASISGLAVNPGNSRELYITDRNTNSLYRLMW